jgi:acyl-CoA synthetase (AMP-forming)/AMP-acid ligase II
MNKQISYDDFMLPAEVDDFVGVLRYRAALTPDRQAFGFLRDTGTDEDVLTYAELDRDARVIAAKLQWLGLAGGRAVLLYQPSLDYIRALFGCFYAGMTAVPVYAPRMNGSYERIRQTVLNARASALLSTDVILEGLNRAEWSELGAGGPQWIGTDNLPPLLAARWQAPEVGPDSLAVLQYTSGSTGIPKGVMLNQRHLMLNSSMIRRAMDIDEHSVGVVWLPPYHDMGLIGGILQPVFSGIPIHLLSPYSFLQRPLRWLDAMTRYRGTISSAPNFAYSLCANRIKPEQLERLDLSNWRLAANGAEPIRADTLASTLARSSPATALPKRPCMSRAARSRRGRVCAGSMPRRWRKAASPRATTRRAMPACWSAAASLRPNSTSGSSIRPTGRPASRAISAKSGSAADRSRPATGIVRPKPRRRSERPCPASTGHSCGPATLAACMTASFTLPAASRI